MEECFECGKESTEDHHVIPKSMGGTKTVPLCGGCHSLVHGGYHKRRDDHRELTIAGLKRAKARGIKLGNRKNLSKAGRLGSKTTKDMAYVFAKNLEEKIRLLLEQELSLRAIAEIFNSEGVKTARGGKWTAQTVANILKRLAS